MNLNTIKNISSELFQALREQETVLPLTDRYPEIEINLDIIILGSHHRNYTINFPVSILYYPKYLTCIAYINFYMEGEKSFWGKNLLTNITKV